MPRPRDSRSITQIELDARAVDLKRRNKTYQQIKEELGFSSTSRAHAAVQRGLRFAFRDAADDVIQLENDRLDEMARIAWGIAHKRHFVVDRGEVICHPETGLPLNDSGPVLAAIGKLLDVSKRRAQLNGYDAPKRVDLTIHEVESEIARLRGELANDAEFGELPG